MTSTHQKRSCDDGKGGTCNGARTRQGLFVCSALYTTLFAGAFFGWGPMKLMLEENGAFASRCEEVDEDNIGAPCAKQTASLLNVQMIALSLFIFSPLLGEVSDRFGAPALMNLLGICGSTGLALVTTASALKIDALLYPALLLVAVMSISTTIIIVSTGMVFVGRDRSRVISALNALFDAGSVTYLALWAIKEATGVSLAAIAGAYAGLGVLCFGGAAYFWRVVVYAEEAPVCRREKLTSLTNETASCSNSIPSDGCDVELGQEITSENSTKGGELASDKCHMPEKQVTDMNTNGKQNDDIITPKPRAEINDLKHTSERFDEVKEGQTVCCSNLVPSDGCDVELGEEVTSECSSKEGQFTSDKGHMQEKQAADIVVETERKQNDDIITPKLRSETKDLKHIPAKSLEKTDRFDDEVLRKEGQNPSYVPISQRPPLKQLQSGQFLLLAAFFAIHVAKNLFTLTTARDFLAYLGDDETGHRYLAVFTLLLPASVVGLPFVDEALNKYGYHAGLQVVNILSLIHGIIQVSSDNLNVQVFGFVVFSFFRCFLFSVVFSFLPTFLGVKVIGKGAGLLNLAAGLCSFLNIPLANAAMEKFGGNFFVPNLFYTILVVPCVSIALCIMEGIEKERRTP